MKDAKYIACAIDTDGRVGFTKDLNRKKTNFIFTPNLDISNNNKRWIQHVHGLLDFRGIIERQSSRCFRIRITRQREVKEVLEFILPFLIIKQERGRLILEFCNSRLTREKHKAPYTPKELALVKMVYELNKR